VRLSAWRAHWDERMPSLPLALLVLVCLVSAAARIAWIAEPCRAPCAAPADHILVFDETYYVNAARVIAGVALPPGANYAGSPAGVDPNSEHPQLAKLVIAGSIELFGDGPLAWRLGSIVFGTLTILGMFYLVRCAGGRRWLALGAAALIASDNLQIVHGRIGTLDVYALAAMIWAAALYLRARILAAGILIGIGAAFKEVAAYVLLVLVLFEALRYLQSRSAGRRRAVRVGACATTSAAVLIGLLAVMDRIAAPYDPQTHSLVGGGVFGQIAHMLNFAAGQTSRHGPQGIASYPWEWLADYRPITYLYINPKRPADGLFHVHPAVHFLGVVSPPILLLALPAVAIAGRRLLRGESSRISALGLAWFLGTFAPFEVLSLVFARTSYLYYMVVVMPGIYLLVADLIARQLRHRRLVAGWVVCVIAATVSMYPFTPLPW
jgi:predicted membrane-bound dolichyl-phosphate-mannose-protein mannosyltransferase